jgi:glycosyltransferase involved in cell wall biosynthesis
MTRKKVLITSNLYLPNIGGIENSIYYLAKEGVESGDLITIVTSNIISKDSGEDGRNLSECQIIKYEANKYKNKILNFMLHLFNSYKIYRIIKDRQFDLVISRYHLNTLICHLAGHRKINYIVPGVFKYQNKPLTNTKILNNIPRKINYYMNCQIQNLAFKVSDKIWVFSDNMKEQILSIENKCLPLETKPGVDSEAFGYADNSSNENINLLILSRLSEQKNIAMAIESLKYLPDNYKLTIVGGGVLIDDLKELCKIFNIESRVSFEGAKSNVANYYHRSHIFLLPSIYEPFGQTLLEASSCGIPTVAFHSSIVKTATVRILGDYGIYAHKLNSVEYANAIVMAFELYYKTKEKSRLELRHKITSDYSWKRLYAELVST